MPLTETLTVQILGDSSDLQQELTQVADLLAGLQQQLADAAGATGEFGNAFQGLSSALRPLQGISNQLAAISQQIQALAQQPVTLNVAPALEALQQLLQAAQATAQQLAALNLSIGLGGIGGMLPTGGGEGAVRGYASGGLVSGPTGIDQVSARLTAGEYILNSRAVATIGVTQLDQLNAGRTGALQIPNATWQSTTVTAARPTFAPPIAFDSPRLSNSRPAPSESSGQQTTNHFGGIEINVRETANVDQLLHDLRRQGIGQRHRRG